MSSSEDEDMKLAIALSMRDRVPSGIIDLDSEEDQPPVKASKPASENPALNFLGINRKQMEQDRLARKRKVSVSPPPPRKAQKINVHEHSMSAKIEQASTPHTAPQKLANGSDTDLFIGGVVKKTRAFGHSRTSEDIKLEEVLRKDELKLAVLSSFQWDMSWLLSKVDLNKTQVTFVMQAKDEAIKQQYRRETSDVRNLRLCFPSMEGQVNCMHSKLMLLSYSDHLRVVVPTANLVPYDWGESGDMENMIFIIDLPRLSHNKERPPETDFQRELVYFLAAMGLEQSIIDSIPNFDFTATNHLAFIHTIGGAHNGDSWRRTGYCGLGQAVTSLGLATESAPIVDFVTSSVGSLNVDFLAMLYLAAQGDDGSTEYGWRNPETGKGKGKKSKLEMADSEAAQEAVREDVRKNFHIYFPTHDTVKASTAGYAGTICFQSKWYNSPTFPRHALRDCKSTRTGLLMHNKILYVRPTDPTGTPWAYIGSANCSESAWGKLSKDRVTKEPKLNCRNWECGVVVSMQQSKGSGKVQNDLSAF